MSKKGKSNVYGGFKEIKSKNLIRWESKTSKEYKEYRKKWVDFPRKLIIPKFPFHLDIESTSNCNLLCGMCARTVRIKRGKWRKIKNLDLNTFKKIIDESSKKGLYAINLNNLGEPLLNPNLSKMVKYAKNNGIIDVFFHTNAVNLNEKISKDLINSGLDKLIISFDSPYKEKYERIRVGANFDRVLDNIKKFNEIKKKLNKITPITRINFIKFPDTRKKEIDELINLFSNIIDSIGVLEYVDPYKKVKKNFKKGHISKFICPQIITRLNIWEDGKIFPCCMDYDGEMCLGNIKEITLEDAWNSKKLEYIRKKHFEGKFYEIPACRKCEFALKGNQQKI